MQFCLLAYDVADLKFVPCVSSRNCSHNQRFSIAKSNGMAMKRRARRLATPALFIVSLGLFILAVWSRFNHCRAKVPALHSQPDQKATEAQATSQETPAPPVPCLGIVVGSDPNLFLLRLLYSIDHAVERLIIAYGGNETSVDAELNHASHSFPNLTTSYLGRWSGVAQGWNRIIESCPGADWYMILNMDAQVAVC